jgi:hypothetical protein
MFTKTRNLKSGEKAFPPGGPNEIFMLKADRVMRRASASTKGDKIAAIAKTGRSKAKFILFPAVHCE